MPTECRESEELRIDQATLLEIGLYNPKEDTDLTKLFGKLTLTEASTQFVGFKE